MQLNFNELRELILTLEQTDITELTLKSDDFELTLTRGRSIDQTNALLQTSGMSPSGVVPTAAAPLLTPPAIPSAPESTPRAVADMGVAATPAMTASTPPPNDKKWVEVTSPMVGTFYRAPAPDEPPFVDVGDRIRTGQTVCIIEAMKLMNELDAEISGEVMEILVQNGEPVEYGQVLMRVNPG